MTVAAATKNQASHQLFHAAAADENADTTTTTTTTTTNARIFKNAVQLCGKWASALEFAEHFVRRYVSEICFADFLTRRVDIDTAMYE